MIIRGILQSLSKVYDGPFSTEPCVALAYSQLETIANLVIRYIQNFRLLIRTRVCQLPPNVPSIL